MRIKEVRPVWSIVVQQSYLGRHDFEFFIKDHRKLSGRNYLTKRNPTFPTKSAAVLGSQFVVAMEVLRLYLCERGYYRHIGASFP